MKPRAERVRGQLSERNSIRVDFLLQERAILSLVVFFNAAIKEYLINHNLMEEN